MAYGGPDSRRDWERLARVDAEWAIVSRTGRRRRDGTPWTRTEFLATGESDAMEILERLGMASVDGLRALEVGCGAGEKAALRLIDEIHRVLKPGARALLHIPERSRRNLRWRAYRLLTRLGLAIDPTGPLSAIPMFGIPREKVMARLGELGFASVESRVSGMSTCYVARK